MEKERVNAEIDAEKINWRENSKQDRHKEIAKPIR
jgi:hypothetical protein